MNIHESWDRIVNFYFVKKMARIIIENSAMQDNQLSETIIHLNHVECMSMKKPNGSKIDFTGLNIGGCEKEEEKINWIERN